LSGCTTAASQEGLSTMKVVSYTSKGNTDSLVTKEKNGRGYEAGTGLVESTEQAEKSFVM
jgi:hypothetical protein